MRRMAVRFLAKLLDGADCQPELRMQMAFGRGREGVGFPGGDPRFGIQEFDQGLADAGRVRIGHEQTQIVAKIGEFGLPLQGHQHVGQHRGPAGVEGVEGQGADVGMLDR